MRRLKSAIAVLLLLCANSAIAAPPQDRETVLIVRDYRYIPGSEKDDAAMGISLCGTRCNAISFDYLNLIEAGGWRMTRTSEHRELSVNLDNPFMGGTCVCIADEFLVQRDDLYRSKQ